MKRHDTHILSESEEEEDISDEIHKYSFNNSKNSYNKTNNSNNSFYSNNPKRNSPFRINNLNINDNDYNNDEISIISSKEIEDIFYIEKRKSIKNIKKVKDKDKDKDKEKDKGKNISIKKNNNKNEDNNNNNNNNKNNFIINNKQIVYIESNIIKKENKEPEPIDKKINIDKKEKENKDINNIKIKIIKLNNENNNELIINCLTYTPCLINYNEIKYKIKKRNCISLNNSFIKSKNNIRRKKKKVATMSIRNIKNKKLKLPSQLDSVNYNDSSFNNVNNVDKPDKNLKKLIDIIKQKKIKSLKVSKNSFSIKTKIINPILLEDYIKNPYINYNNYINKKDYLYDINHKIVHQNDFFLQKDKYRKNKKINYFLPLYKFQINGRKELQYIQQGKKLKDNYYSSLNLISSNNSRYSNSSKKNKYCISTMNKFTNNKLKKNLHLKLKNEKKIKILYDLYCKNQEPHKKNNMPRIKSAFSLNEHKHKFDFYQKSNLLNNNINFKNQTKFNNNIFSNNKKNWIFRLIKLKKIKNMYNYDKHFGNNESCPLCQEMNKKNKESIIEKGISPIVQEDKNNNSKSSLHNRRIYSACYGKKKNESSKSDIHNENDNDDNKSRNLNNNKSGFNSIMIMENNNQKINKLLNSIIKRKLIFNRPHQQEKNFTYSNNKF